MKLNAISFANAAAILDAVGHFLFAVLDTVRPGVNAFLVNHWVQGVKFEYSRAPIWRGFLLGWLTEILFAWITIYSLISLYNHFVKTK